MKSFNIVAVASLLTLAYATPVERRALVVHTVIEEVTETIDSTTTIWVKATAGAHANYQLSTSKHQHHQHTHKPKPVTPTTISTPSVAPVPTTPTTTSTSSSTSVSVPVFTPPVVPTTPAFTPPVVPTTPPSTPPVVPTTPVYTPPVIPVTTPAPVPTPEPTTQAPVPVPTTASSSEGPAGGACGDVGGECSGDITYYEAGLGACGWTNDGSSEDVFALAHGMMGEQSNGNPFCGRMAKIKVPGKPVVSAKLVDKCMGCEGQSIDLSNHLFDQLAVEAEGRLHNIEWWFTS